MTITAAIIANVFADIALIGGLSYLMSRASRLTPRVEATAESPLATTQRRSHSAGRHSRRSNSGLVPAYPRQSE